MHIFICEGKTECNFLNHLFQTLGVNGTWQCVFSQDNQNQLMFKPVVLKRFYNRYIQNVQPARNMPPFLMVGQIDGNFYRNTTGRYEYRCGNDLEINQDNVFIIVDNDVFYKHLDIQYVQEFDFEDFDTYYSEGIQDKVKGQNLNFEDFIVLLFGSDDLYESWFKSRFGYKYTDNRKEYEYEYEGMPEDAKPQFGNTRNINGDNLKEELRNRIIDFQEQGNICFGRDNNNGRYYYDFDAMFRTMSPEDLNNIIQRAQGRLANNKTTTWPDSMGLTNISEVFNNDKR